MPENITDLNKSFWNKRAKNNSFFVAGAPMKKQNPANSLIGQYRNRTEYKHLTRKIDLRGKTLLDLGCGTGRLSFQFAKKCKKVVGVDFAEGMIEQANNYAKEHNISNTQFFVSDLQKVDFDETFDIVFFGGVLMCIEDDDVKGIVKNLHNFITKDTIIVNRDTVALIPKRMTSKDLVGRDDFTTYRPIEEIKAIFTQNNFDTLYQSETYPFVLGLNLYERLSSKMKKTKLILFLLNILLLIQSEILDPLLLKHKWIYKKQYNAWVNSSYPLRQFYFFHKIKKND